tara:strand:- start:107 stop:241 length:135 start_codon:yes stop_codon:yes gene_type:complete
MNEVELKRIFSLIISTKDLDENILPVAVVLFSNTRYFVDEEDDY